MRLPLIGSQQILAPIYTKFSYQQIWHQRKYWLLDFLILPEPDWSGGLPSQQLLLWVRKLEKYYCSNLIWVKEVLKQIQGDTSMQGLKLLNLIFKHLTWLRVGTYCWIYIQQQVPKHLAHAPLLRSTALLRSCPCFWVSFPWTQEQREENDGGESLVHAQTLPC